MNLIWAITLMLMFLLAAGNLTAQDNTPDLERFRVLLNNGERIEGRNGLLSSTGLEGTSTKGLPISLAGSEIRVLDRYSGSNAGKGAIIGAAAGLSLALASYIAAKSEADSDPYKVVDNSRIVPIFGGFTAAGALIGWAIGSSQKKWEKVPLGTAFNFNPQSGERKLVFTLSF